MDYVIVTPERGLFLAPKREWDGEYPDFKFEICSKSSPVMLSAKI